MRVYVDETGDFGTTLGSSILYGISFVFYNPKVNIFKEINILNEALNIIGCKDMFHMADIVYNRNYFKNFNLKERKKIFELFYNFLRKIDVKIYSIIIDKRYIDNTLVLRKHIINELEKMINNNKNYFNKYNEIILYYDNGQEKLGNILDNVFSKFSNYIHIIEFDHQKEKLFQVADMLTYLDKRNCLYNQKIKISNTEKIIFDDEYIRNILKDIHSKRLK